MVSANISNALQFIDPSLLSYLNGTDIGVRTSSKVTTSSTYQLVLSSTYRYLYW